MPRIMFASVEAGETKTNSDLMNTLSHLRVIAHTVVQI